MLTGISVPEFQTRALYIRQQWSISLEPLLDSVLTAPNKLHFLCNEVSSWHILRPRRP